MPPGTLPGLDNLKLKQFCFLGVQMLQAEGVPSELQDLDFPPTKRHRLGRLSIRDLKPSGRRAFLVWPFLLQAVIAKIALTDGFHHAAASEDASTPAGPVKDSIASIPAESTPTVSVAHEEAGSPDAVRFSAMMRLSLDQGTSSNASLASPTQTATHPGPQLDAGGDGGGGADGGGNEAGADHLDASPSVNNSVLEPEIGIRLDLPFAGISATVADGEVGVTVNLHGLDLSGLGLTDALGLSGLDLATTLSELHLNPISIAIVNPVADLAALLGPDSELGHAALTALEEIGLQGIAEPQLAMSSSDLKTDHVQQSGGLTVVTDELDAALLQNQGTLPAGDHLAFAAQANSPVEQQDELFSGSKYTDYNVALQKGSGGPLDHTPISANESGPLIDEHVQPAPHDTVIPALADHSLTGASLEPAEGSRHFPMDHVH